MSTSILFSTGWSRFWALIIDGIVLAILGWIMGLLPVYLPIRDILVVVLQLFYLAACHGPLGQGQTLGKKILGLRVIRLDGPSLRWSHALVRALVDRMTVVIPIFSLAPAYLPPLLVLVSAGIIGFLGACNILNIAVFFSTPERRALHDYLAGTVVIKTVKEPLASSDREVLQRLPRWQWKHFGLGLAIAGAFFVAVTATRAYWLRLPAASNIAKTELLLRQHGIDQAKIKSHDSTFSSIGLIEINPPFFRRWKPDHFKDGGAGTVFLQTFLEEMRDQNIDFDPVMGLKVTVSRRPQDLYDWLQLDFRTQSWKINGTPPQITYEGEGRSSP